MVTGSNRTPFWAQNIPLSKTLSLLCKFYFKPRSHVYKICTLLDAELGIAEAGYGNSYDLGRYCSGRSCKDSTATGEYLPLPFLPTLAGIYHAKSPPLLKRSTKRHGKIYRPTKAPRVDCLNPRALAFARLRDLSGETVEIPNRKKISENRYFSSPKLQANKVYRQAYKNKISMQYIHTQCSCAMMGLQATAGKRKLEGGVGCMEFDMDMGESPSKLGRMEGSWWAMEDSYTPPLSQTPASYYDMEWGTPHHYEPPTIRREENGKSYLELGSSYRANERCCEGSRSSWCRRGRACYRQRRLAVLNISMCKLARYRQFPDPSLHRSVLICNTLRHLEREMERDRSPPPMEPVIPAPIAQLQPPEQGRLTPFPMPPTPSNETDADSGIGDSDDSRSINWGSVLSLSSQSPLDPLNNNELLDVDIGPDLDLDFMPGWNDNTVNIIDTLCRCIAYRFNKISSSKESAATDKECKQQMQRKKTINLKKKSKRITHDMDNNNKNYQKQ
ncbi:hypothetical protein WN51_04403 [Melipona quadrifasciata]|uniref:SERTA domain-containing protein n=1 Tax=Melipona quadrifasciata TaxID=166423 RepID=A0A0M8ZX06_9HYME|nr:hypothetical protein WN51_04403 [Melipona quadrifasciata]